MAEEKMSQGERDASNLPYDVVKPALFRPDPDGRANHVQHKDGTVFHVTGAAYEHLTGEKARFVNLSVPASEEVTIRLQQQVNSLQAQLTEARAKVALVPIVKATGAETT